MMRTQTQTNDGELTVTVSESEHKSVPTYINLVDGRDKTMDHFEHSHHDKISFSFKVDHKKEELVLSRIFAETNSGSGSALDMRPSLLGESYVDTYKYRCLLDTEAMKLLQETYPEYTINTHRLRDKIRNLIT